MRALVKLAATNVAVLCTLIVILEGGLQALFYLMRGHPVYGNPSEVKALSELFEQHPYLVWRPRRNVTVQGLRPVRPGVPSDSISFTITDRHTRWTGAPVNDSTLFRVAALGGSTTFGDGVTDAESWPAQLQSSLGPTFSVANHGVPAYSTAEAIIQMGLVVGESKPHLVIFYGGWNDIRNYHNSALGPDYYAHGMEQFANLGTMVGGGSAFDRLNAVSATARFAKALSLRLSLRERPIEPHRDPDPYVDRLYARNLQTIGLLARSMGADILFVPQILNYAGFLRQSGSSPWTARIHSQSIPALMDHFNSVMAATCPPVESACTFVGDIAGVQWTDDDFVDDEGHFSPQGNRRFAAVLERHVWAHRRRAGQGLEPSGGPRSIH